MDSSFEKLPCDLTIIPLQIPGSCFASVCNFVGTHGLCKKVLVLPSLVQAPIVKTYNAQKSECPYYSSFHFFSIIPI